MEKEKTFDCLCIKSIDYKENDKLVTLYAFGEGKITATLKGVKKSKAKLKFAGALLCFAKYYLAGRNGYYSVIGCDLVDNFYGIWTDIDKYYAALCCLEILDKVADDREIGDKLAALTLEFLNEICYKNTNIFLSFASYLSKTTQILGYRIAPVCTNCGDDKNLSFSLLYGALTCKDCKEYNAISLSEQSVQLIRILYKNIDLKNLPENVQFKDEDVISVIRCFFEVIGKNLAKKFKTFEEYNLFYNKNIIYNKITWNKW